MLPEELPDEEPPLELELDELLEVDDDSLPEEVAPEELEPLVAPLDELLEVDVEAKGVEAIGLLPVPVVGSVSVLAGGVTATTLLLASLAEPALCDEPSHPDSRTTEMTSALSIWAKSPKRRSIFMCARLANG